MEANVKMPTEKPVTLVLGIKGMPGFGLSSILLIFKTN